MFKRKNSKKANVYFARNRSSKKNTSFYIHTNCVSDPKLLVIIAIKLISGTLGNSTGVTSYQTSLNNEKQ